MHESNTLVQTNSVNVEEKRLYKIFCIFKDTFFWDHCNVIFTLSICLSVIKHTKKSCFIMVINVYAKYCNIPKQKTCPSRTATNLDPSKVPVTASWGRGDEIPKSSECLKIRPSVYEENGLVLLR